MWNNDGGIREIEGTLGDLHNGSETLIDLTIMSRRIRAALGTPQNNYRPMTWRITRSSPNQIDRLPTDKFTAWIPVRPRRVKD